MKTDNHYAFNSLNIDGTMYRLGQSYKGGVITHLGAKVDCSEPFITVTKNGTTNNYYL